MGLKEVFGRANMKSVWGLLFFFPLTLSVFFLQHLSPSFSLKPLFPIAICGTINRCLYQRHLFFDKGFKIKIGHSCFGFASRTGLFLVISWSSFIILKDRSPHFCSQSSILCCRYFGYERYYLLQKYFSTVLALLVGRAWFAALSPTVMSLGWCG